MKSKLKVPDLENLCQNYDIVSFIETKFDDYDSVNIANFTGLPTLNRKKFKNKSGGIAVYVKSYLFDYILPLKSGNDNVLWFTFKNCIFSEPVVFGVVYIPPEGSSYSSIDIFDSIESELVHFISEKNYKICLMGDFNSHTRTLPDFVNVDDQICEFLKLDTNTMNNLNQNTLDSYGISSVRHNMDKSPVDNYGKRLLNLCKSLDIHIINGRVGNDRNIGNFTCKGSTVVDYCIASPELFNKFLEFEVLPFDPMISDVHCALHFVLSINEKPEYFVKDSDDICIKPKWVKEKTIDFINNLNEEEIEVLNRKLDTVNIDLIDQETVENLIGECNSILSIAASSSDMLKIFKQNNNKKEIKLNKPWFSTECHA